MKKLVCVMMLVFVVGVLFYSRSLDDMGDVRYVYERDNGLVVGEIDYGDSKCSYISIESDEIDYFLDYYDVVVVDRYYIDDMLVLNAYSKYFDNTITLSDKKYNLQIAFSDQILIGCPQLYLGF